MSRRTRKGGKLFLDYVGPVVGLVCLGGAIKDGAPWWAYILIAALILYCVFTFPETDQFGHPIRR